MAGIVEVLLGLLFGGIGRTLRSSARRTSPEDGGSRSPARALRPWRTAATTVVDGVPVQVSAVAPAGARRWLFVQVRASAATALAPSLVRLCSWGPRPWPMSRAELVTLPLLRATATSVDCGDAIGGGALPALASTWRGAVAASPLVALASDGRDVIAWIDEARRPAQVRRVMAAVAAVARWDAALAATLAGLPGAAPLADAVMSPAAVLAPDGLRVGLVAGALVAELAVPGVRGIPTEHVDGAGAYTLARDAGHARLTWRGVERDPRRLRAGIEILRALEPARAGGPYR